MANHYSLLSREDLLKALESKENEIIELKKQHETILNKHSIEVVTDVKEDAPSIPREANHLSNMDIARYSRQLILPELGVNRQIKLKNSSILIVGGGGLGCPASLYLAAAGVGKIGVIDYDEVELSNLHRQISHSEERIGVSKALSIAQTCKSLNSSVHCVPYQFQINSLNALQVIKSYDIILDATDNVATRYLLNDACVLAGKPLVSGSALRLEGQLTVYNCDGGPCYRCLFPQPPPPETVTNCSDGGVLGVVPGIIGSLQALESIKLAAGLGSSYRQRLLLFDAMEGTFRNVKLRPRSPKCVVCGDNPSITELIDYEQFCGARASDKDRALHVLSDSDRIHPQDYAAMLEKKNPHVLVDVRPEVEIDICKLPHDAINIPIQAIRKDPSNALEEINRKLQQLKKETESETTTEDNIPVVCVCRKGNDSQVAVGMLRKLTTTENEKGDSESCHFITDIRGGLHAWARKVDPEFPMY